MTVGPIEIVDDLEFDVCPWPVAKSCVTTEWNNLDPEIQHWSLALASATLHRLSGYRVGGCPLTVRPCKKSCAEQYGTFVGGTFTPFMDLAGEWVNSCGCTYECSCGSTCFVDLPGPVGELIEVQVGADDVTADVVVRGNRIIWTGEAECPFPACQDMGLEPGVEGAFAVTYRNSFPVDAMGARAVGVLAMEFAKQCTTGKCELPRGTTRVVRQGVSVDIVTGSFPGGYTGIKEIDAWIGLWRGPKSPTQPTMMWSPGMGTTTVH